MVRLWPSKRAAHVLNYVCTVVMLLHCLFQNPKPTNRTKMIAATLFHLGVEATRYLPKPIDTINRIDNAPNNYTDII